MTVRKAPAADRIAHVCQLIRRAPQRQLRVDSLARQARMSKFHFIRAFKSATGQTPHQFVRACRIDRAQHLLATTPMPIAEVCEAAGFESLGSFAATFRRLTGETPAAFRAARRKNVYIPACFVRMYRQV